MVKLKEDASNRWRFFMSSSDEWFLQRKANNNYH